MSGNETRGRWAMLCVAMASVAGCAGGDTESPVDAPGAAKTATTTGLEAGAGILQNKAPLQALDTYLDGFHFYNGRMSGQMEAHHYCRDRKSVV